MVFERTPVGHDALHPTRALEEIHQERKSELLRFDHMPQLRTRMPIVVNVVAMDGFMVVRLELAMLLGNA